MAKSRNRGGAKAHRKRVQKRNEKLGIAKKQFEKAFNKMYSEKMQEIAKAFESMSANTENGEEPVTDINISTQMVNEEQISSEEKIETSSTEVESGQSN